ncbi:MAG: hypothetical protein Q8O76_01005, partial [Chloroflexota bacterium]|nr:hypothetical protein [Chloroflexota bacterium]
VGKQVGWPDFAWMEEWEETYRVCHGEPLARRGRVVAPSVSRRRIHAWLQGESTTPVKARRV